MPLQRRLPKVGFRSKIAPTVAEVRLSELAKVKGDVIDLASLKAANLVPEQALRARIVASGDVGQRRDGQGRARDQGRARRDRSAPAARSRRPESVATSATDSTWPPNPPAAASLAAFGEMTRFAELRQRLFFLLGALIVYRIGTFIPVPGIDPVALARFFEEQQGTILDIFNMFSGGALERLSIFALGVMPYISASIIVQMMAVVVPQLAAIKKEGESGRRKLTQYTRYGTVLLAAVQGASAAVAFQNQGVVIAPGPQFVFIATITLVAGTMFLMWLGEQITERGLGNGISMIILAGIVAGLPAAVGGTLELVRTGEMNPAFALILFAHGDRGDGLRRVRRARPAPHPGQLREAPAGPSHVRRPEHAPAVQAEHVGRDPADLRLEPAAVPGDDRQLVGHGRRLELAAERRRGA